MSKITKLQFLSGQNISTSNTVNEVESPFSCDVCSDAFDTKKELRAHRLIHTEEMIQECSSNGLDFSKTIGKLKTRKRNANPHGKCYVCGSIFKKREAFQQHLFTHNLKKKFVCFDCGQGFDKLPHLVQHERSHQSHANLFECDDCSRVYDSSRSFKKHMANYADKPFKCRICKLEFESVCKLKKHHIVHGKVGPICQVCNIRFGRRVVLEDHMLTHAGQKEFKCGFCEVTFPRYKLLEKHVLIHTNNPYCCGDCGRSFTTMSDLEVHQTVGVDDKKWPCVVCGENLSSRCAQTKHRYIHGNEAKTCKECGKVFANQGYLDKHAITHTGENHHGSGKTIALNASLSKHYLTHDEKPYSCVDCGEAYTYKINLDLHRTVYNDENAFQCRLCEKGFYSKCALNLHHSIHTGYKNSLYAHGENDNESNNIHNENGSDDGHDSCCVDISHECDLCDVSFPDESSLASHRLSHFGEKFLGSFLRKRQNMFDDNYEKD